MGDFIPFGGGTDVKQTNSFIQKPTTPKSDLKAGLKLTGMPAFGSPAVNIGGNQIAFGSPAITSQKTNTNTTHNITTPSPNPRYPNYQSTPRGDSRPNFSPRNRHAYSPRHQNSFSPRHQGSFSPRHQGSFSPRHQGSFSPRHQNSYQFTPSPYNARNQSRDSSDNSSFKTPQQFSPGPMRGGRWSFNRQKNSRFDPNSNAGGSANIEDYYNHSMVQDPWKNLCPVLTNTR